MPAALLVMDFQLRIVERFDGLTEKVFPRQADVTTVDEWVAGLG